MGVRLARTNLAELLPGTLDLLVLRTLVREANHGYGIEASAQIRANGAAFTNRVQLVGNLDTLLYCGILSRWPVIHPRFTQGGLNAATFR
jgi:hypothetical protein